MAAILPKGGLPASYFDNGDTNGGFNLKLRDSCLACAHSKLRCPREKPGCSRCAKRNVPCEYVATKRAGRKQGGLSNANNKSAEHSRRTSTGANHNSKPSPSSDTNYKQSPTITGKDFTVMSPLTMFGSSSTENVPASYYPSFSSTDFQMSDVAASDINKDIEELLAFCPQPTPNMSEDSFAMNWDNNLLFDNNDPSMTMTDGQIDFTSLQSLLNFSSPESSQLDLNTFMTSPNTDMDIQPQQPSSTGTDEPCTCVAQALGFVQQLYQAPSDGTSQTASHNANVTSTVKAIISRNNTIADEVEKFLRCPTCSHNGFMLTILYFLVSRLLGWYAAAARKAHSADRTSSLPAQKDDWACSSVDSHSRNSSVSTTLSGPGNGSPTSYFVEGQDSARAAAHMVVNEMHRVRDLVTQLFAQLSLWAAISTSITDSSSGLDYVENTDWPLSGTILNQLGMDLRKRIKALTTDILSMLRTW